MKNDKKGLTKKLLHYPKEIQELKEKQIALKESTTPSNKETRKIEDEMIRKHMQRTTEKMYEIKKNLIQQQRIK